jgi:hypothetical protein
MKHEKNSKNASLSLDAKIRNHITPISPIILCELVQNLRKTTIIKKPFPHSLESATLIMRYKNALSWTMPKDRFVESRWIMDSCHFYFSISIPLPFNYCPLLLKCLFLMLLQHISPKRLRWDSNVFYSMEVSITFTLVILSRSYLAWPVIQHNIFISATLNLFVSGSLPPILSPTHNIEELIIRRKFFPISLSGLQFHTQIKYVFIQQWR